MSEWIVGRVWRWRPLIRRRRLIAFIKLQVLALEDDQRFYAASVLKQLQSNLESGMSLARATGRERHDGRS